MGAAFLGPIGGISAAISTSAAYFHYLSASIPAKIVGQTKRAANNILPNPTRNLISEHKESKSSKGIDQTSQTQPKQQNLPEAGKSNQSVQISKGSQIGPQSNIRIFENLNNDVLSCIFTFMEDISVARLEQVSKNWKNIIEKIVWKELCHRKMNIPRSMNLKVFLPPESSYKNGARHAYTKVYDAKKYKELFNRVLSNKYNREYGSGYRFEVELEEDIRKEILLTHASKPDPYDPSKTIGQNYVCLLVPSYFIVKPSGKKDEFPYALDTNTNFKARVERDRGLSYYSKSRNLPKERLAPRIFIPRSDSTPTIENSKVFNTINNITTLLFHRYVCDQYEPDKGDIRIPSGTVWIREEAVNSTFYPLYTKEKTEISHTGHRVLLNYLRYSETDSSSCCDINIIKKHSDTQFSMVLPTTIYFNPHPSYGYDSDVSLISPYDYLQFNEEFWCESRLTNSFMDFNSIQINKMSISLQTSPEDDEKKTFK